MSANSSLPPSYYTEPLISHAFQDRNLIDFGSGAGNISSPPTSSQTPSQPLNRLSALVSGPASRRTPLATPQGILRSGSPGVSGGSPSRGGGEYFAAGEGDGAGGMGGRGKLKLSCAVGYGMNLYLGTSDGQIWWYTLEYGHASSSNSPQDTGPYTLRNRHTISSRKPIDKILLLPRVGKMAILSDKALYFLSLPSLDPLTSTNILPIRNVLDVVLDDQEIAWRPGDEEGGAKGVEISLRVIKANVIGLWRLGGKLSFHKDIVVPGTPTLTVHSGTSIACAIDSMYCTVDLENESLSEVIPINQVAGDPAHDDASIGPNLVVLPGVEEYLCTTYTGGNTIGIFMNGEGDAVKGTIEWPCHPKSIVIEGDSVLALLPDDTISIHSIQEMAPIQSITLPLGVVPLTLSSNPYGIAVPNRKRDEKLSSRSVLILPRHHGSPPNMERVQSDDDLLDSETAFEPPSGSGLSPPLQASPFRLDNASSRTQGSSTSGAVMSRPATTSIGETLVLTDDGVLAVGLMSWVAVADALIEKGQIDDVIRIAEEEKRKGKRGELEIEKTAHTADLRYIYARIAYRNLNRTYLDEAGSYFQKSRIDPRFVIRLLRSHVRNSIGWQDEAYVWDGVVKDAEKARDFTEVVEQKVREVFGTSPANADDPNSDVQVFRLQLNQLAKTTLLAFLRKTRTSRRKGNGNGKDADRERSINVAVDSCMGKLLAENGDADELLELLSSPNDCIREELEDFVDPKTQPYLLSQVMRMNGATEKAIPILMKIVDGETPDARCADPLGEVSALLVDSRDAAVSRKHGLWLLKRDRASGLKLFKSMDAGVVSAEDTQQLLKEMREVSPDAADDYLEHVIVVRRSTDKTLHDAYVKHLLDTCETFMADEGVIYHYKEIYDEYRSTRPNMTYCQFIAEMAHDSPSKTARLKTIFFLQGSPYYDLHVVEKRLDAIGRLFYERAIVYGRLGRHDKALKLIAVEMHDSVSAETYCTQGGEVLPPKIARAIASKLKYLEPWSTLGEVGRRRRGTIEGELRQNLVLTLLRVYMSDGSTTAPQTAALLNAQGLHLDSLQVLSLVPDDWKVQDVSDFFGRALKRQLHERSHWQIMKSLAAGQNMRIAEEYARTVGKTPSITQYPPTPPYAPPGESPALTLPDEGSIPEVEHSGMLEKDEGGVDSGGREKEKTVEKEKPARLEVDSGVAKELISRNVSPVVKERPSAQRVDSGSSHPLL